jgi:DNA polymerase-3 subunit epsilon
MLLLQVTTFRDSAVRINPGVPIPEEASRIHGIRDEDVKDRPSFASLAGEFLEYTHGYDLCG